MKHSLALLTFCVAASAQTVTPGPCVLSTGLSDATISGLYTPAARNANYFFVFSSVGTPDHFEWAKNGGALSSPIAVTGANQSFTDGLGIKFAATTGHTLNASCTVIAQIQGSIPGRSAQAGLGAVLRLFDAIHSDRPSVLDYGARGDCSTDDAPAFLAALNTNALIDVPLPPAATYACYMLGPLTFPSGSHLHIAAGVTIKPKPGAYSAGLVAVFQLFSAQNVIIEGNGAIIDWTGSGYSVAAQKYCALISDFTGNTPSTNVIIAGLNCIAPPADGWLAGGNSINTTIRDFNVVNPLRDCFSITAADGILADGGFCSGAAQSAFDIEPDNDTNLLRRVQVNNIFSSKSAGTAANVTLIEHDALQIGTATLNASGTGYVVGDIVHVVQGGSTTATLSVDTLGGGGAVATFHILSGGTGGTAGSPYSVATGLTTTGGTGTGFKVNVTALTGPVDDITISHHSDIGSVLGVVFNSSSPTTRGSLRIESDTSTLPKENCHRIFDQVSPSFSILDIDPVCINPNDSNTGIPLYGADITVGRDSASSSTGIVGYNVTIENPSFFETRVVPLTLKTMMIYDAKLDAEAPIAIRNPQVASGIADVFPWVLAPGSFSDDRGIMTQHFASSGGSLGGNDWPSVVDDLGCASTCIIILPNGYSTTALTVREVTGGRIILAASGGETILPYGTTQGISLPPYQQMKIERFGSGWRVVSAPVLDTFDLYSNVLNGSNAPFTVHDTTSQGQSGFNFMGQVQLTSVGTRPNCGATPSLGSPNVVTSGSMWYARGTATVSQDVVEVCWMNQAGTYAWSQIFPTPGATQTDTVLTGVTPSSSTCTVLPCGPYIFSITPTTFSPVYVNGLHQ